MNTAPLKIWERISARSHRAAWEKGRRVSAAHLLTALGRRPRWLLGDYLTAVRVDPRARGFHHDRGRNVVWGYAVGVDLIPSPQGVWCVEANLNSGAYEYQKPDDWDEWDQSEALEQMFETAKELGVRTLWWHGADWGQIQPHMMSVLQEKARLVGMDVVAREDYKVPATQDFPEGLPRPGKRLTSPIDAPNGTLVIRRNSYEVGTDWVVSNKDPFTRGIDAALREAGDQRCRIPTMTLRPPDLPVLSDDGLPNLVYKYPGFAWGHGVHFMRVRETAEAISIARKLDREVGNNPPGLFQPFVCSHLLPGRRIYDVRCELLVTPLGVTFISAFKRESSRGIPTELAEGLVSARGVFTSNSATGGTSSIVYPPEGDEVRDAAVAVGEAMIRLLSRGFETVT
ncbi:hypothetical protein ACFL3S_01225 [Gemmatimonadota bacterium]